MATTPSSRAYRAGFGGTVATEDLAAAIGYIFRNAAALGVGTRDYSLWEVRPARGWRQRWVRTERPRLAAMSCPNPPSW